MHEIGHNFGWGHSGKRGEGFPRYADPTCHMGNTGVYSNEGREFCFNGAKTWHQGWYSDFHRTLDFDSGIVSFDGRLVGINAVRDNSISDGQYVVIQMKGYSEVDHYIMFNRKTGTNSGVAQDGDKVVIVSQIGPAYQSWWEASLSSGDTWTENNWGGKGNALKVEICSIDKGSPGHAHILVYLEGMQDVGCDRSYLMTPTVSPGLKPIGTPTVSHETSDIPTIRSLIASPVKGKQPCQDSTKRIMYGSSGKERNCSYISKNRLRRCNKIGVKDLCPVTCRQECDCYDKVGLFNFKGEKRDCDWVGKQRERRCGKNRLRSFCPRSCKLC